METHSTKGRPRLNESSLAPGFGWSPWFDFSALMQKIQLWFEITKTAPKKIGAGMSDFKWKHFQGKIILDGRFFSRRRLLQIHSFCKGLYNKLYEHNF